jgi:hypothetical protein
MSGNFKPISRERAEQIREAMNRARATREGLAFDRKTGQFLGADALRNAPQEQVNMIGKFDTHYGA